MINLPCTSCLCATCAADILDRVSPKFHELGLEYDCVGGGRIRHDSKEKKIHIYGYSVVSFSVCPLIYNNVSWTFIVYPRDCFVKVACRFVATVYIVHHVFYDVLIGIAYYYTATCGCIGWVGISGKDHGIITKI